MVLASVGCAAMPVIRPLTFPAGPLTPFEFSGEGPIDVQVVVLRATLGAEGAGMGCRYGCGVQGVKCMGRRAACDIDWLLAATDFRRSAPALGTKPHVST